MNIFIDTISPMSKIILFDDNKEIIEKMDLDIKGNESSMLIPEIDKFLKKNDYSYKDLENIIVVNGPGSFTGVRTTVLAVNTINYIIKKNITAINYFDMFKNYPIIKSSSKRDCFVKMSKNSDIEIINNLDLSKIFTQNSIKKIYGNTNYAFDNIELFEKIDYNGIIKKVEFDNKKQIKASYIKKPNIS